MTLRQDAIEKMANTVRDVGVHPGWTLEAAAAAALDALLDHLEATYTTHDTVDDLLAALREEK